MFELWHYGSKRCRMTPRDGQPPFAVTIHDGTALASQRTFDDHEEAITYAVDELRRATARSEH